MRPPHETFGYAPLQKFPAPDGPVAPVAGPVQRHTDDPFIARTLVVRQAGGYVGVVVLHAHRREPRLFKLVGVFGGEVLGVEVVGHQHRSYVEEPTVDRCWWPTTS